MNKFFILMVIALAVIFSIGLALMYGWKSPITLKIATAITDKKSYSTQDSISVEIKNNLSKGFCFSSCYPYYFEKKTTGWKGINYSECQEKNVADNCVDAKKVKAFQISSPGLDAGIYRLAISVCLGCSVSQAFKEDRWIYSNEFMVK